MSRYLLRFKVETCLTRGSDLAVEFEGHPTVFLFASKAPEDRHAIAQVELEAPKYEEAWGLAATSFLPRVLDALSFATGTPLLLRDLELALKTAPQPLTALYGLLPGLR